MIIKIVKWNVSQSKIFEYNSLISIKKLNIQKIETDILIS